ncbi:hypothetical protein [Hymenobacter cellulosivorans]|uniref:DUF2746 domain-containing protein n=1 Tax=Hymenobacter cellulosivorans TaxID=2932249 RepID=A0ABY4F522_9BACT|nr:hypothetical protein [Hymenobacter cellulosivorans]UOQ51741.1 hypothetical protein MUN80_18495 [Hymenobacter cellulosivorans]
MADSVLEHWGVVTSVVGGFVAVLLYFVKSWRDVEMLKTECQTQQQRAESLTLKVDEYHVAAVAREAKLREEVKLNIEQLRTEALQQRSELRKEMMDLVMKLTETLSGIDKTLMLVDERTKVLTEASKEQQEHNKWADRILARLDNSGPTLA